MESIQAGPRWPLLDGCATRRAERHWQARLPPHTLMQRAGRATARLALALAPHARRIWVACGPGNNGGDGLLAALALARMGKAVHVTWLGSPERAPADTRLAWQAFAAAGLRLADAPPAACDLCIDALLGIGAQRPPQDAMADCIGHIQRLRRAHPATVVLSIDLPSGLLAGTGRAHDVHVQATHTLSLLTLKPGLFTHQGRDAAGEIWFDDLGVSAQAAFAGCDGGWPSAWLNPAPPARERAHATHKGSFGDVALIGGAPGMAGALWLAASAALHQGAGRVYTAALDPAAPALWPGLPEVMCRPVDALPLGHPGTTTVCGCGGGDALAPWLSHVLREARSLVLDADALNALATAGTAEGQPPWHALLLARATQQRATVLTPHPLEAARLLGSDAATVQADRLGAARTLAARFQCTVVLKGSGTVIAAPGQRSHLNPTGNGLLATAGTGDVLAGMIGARLAGGSPAFEAACGAVYQHGLYADRQVGNTTGPAPAIWPATGLTAGQLAAGA
ncbi:MAG: NAD(P)H-hydrate dehydratase [Comamonas sp.]